MTHQHNNAPSHQSVREHYRHLAPAYNKRANRTCIQAYRALLRTHLGEAKRILELGAGAAPLADEISAPLRVICDYSDAMLLSGRGTPHTRAIQADAASLPFDTASFDAVFCINLLEHVPEPRRVYEEAARALVPGGRFLAVTPNGDAAWLLEILERLHLKLPEGPHRFLRFDEAADLAPEGLRLLEHRRFLAFPTGGLRFTRLVDQALGGRAGRGLFQYIVFEKV